EYKDELVALKASAQKENSFISSLAPYMQMPVAFSKFKDTASVNVLLGEVKNTNLPSLEKIKEIGGEYEVFSGEIASGVAIIIPKENRDSLQEILSETEFAPCSIDSDKTAKELVEESKARLEENEKQYLSDIETIMTFESIIDDVKRLYDYLSLEVAKFESRNSTKVTESTFYLEAWLPESEAQRVNEELESCPLSLAYTIREPLKSETPPTLAVNNGVVAPYESITNMYSVPFYKEIDPNAGVAFFFFLMFGMMLSDAGYGLLLTLGAGLVLALRKPPKGELNLVKVIFMGGISTLIWGFLFGSYFGVSASDIGMWYWFNPIEKPMPLLILSLAIGLVQMFVGMAIKMVALIKAKQPVWGVSSAFSWYCLALGIGGIYLASKVGAWMKYLGIVLLVIGVVLLMLSGTFGKKGAKKVTGALSSLYGII
ncbi:MAG: hypothetical protein K2K24_04620, partial [Clostridia bacterium]|nr:hypothetical protein [Clostridia bacterium]